MRVRGVSRKTITAVARMSAAISGNTPATGPGCRFAHPGYERLVPPKNKKRAEARCFAKSSLAAGCPGGAETPPGLENYFLAFFAFLTFFAFFAFFAFLAIASSFGLMGGNATRGMLGGGPTSQHPRWQSQQIRRPLPRTVTLASSRYPQLLCVLAQLWRRDAPHAGETSQALRAARRSQRLVRVNTAPTQPINCASIVPAVRIFIVSKPRRELFGRSESPLSAAAAC